MRKPQFAHGHTLRVDMHCHCSSCLKGVAGWELMHVNEKPCSMRPVTLTACLIAVLMCVVWSLWWSRCWWCHWEIPTHGPWRGGLTLQVPWSGISCSVVLWYGWYHLVYHSFGYQFASLLSGHWTVIQDWSCSWWLTGFCLRMWYPWHETVLCAGFHFLVLSVFAHLQEKIEWNETHVTMVLIFSAAFTFAMTWMWFTTLMGSASIACASGSSRQ
jgi:hypothetical protein